MTLANLAEKLGKISACAEEEKKPLVDEITNYRLTVTRREMSMSDLVDQVAAV